MLPIRLRWDIDILAGDGTHKFSAGVQINVCEIINYVKGFKIRIWGSTSKIDKNHIMMFIPTNIKAA